MKAQLFLSVLVLSVGLSALPSAYAVEPQDTVTPESLRVDALGKLKRLKFILNDDANFCPSQQTLAEQFVRLNELLVIEGHYINQMNNYCNAIRLLNNSTDGAVVNLSDETRKQLDLILNDSIALQDEFSLKFGNLALNLVLRLRSLKDGANYADNAMKVVTETAEQLAKKSDAELIAEFGEYNYANIRSAILTVYNPILQGDLNKVARPVLVEIYRQALMTYMFIDWMDKHYTKLVVIDAALKATERVSTTKDVKPVETPINRQR